MRVHASWVTFPGQQHSQRAGEIKLSTHESRQVQVWTARPQDIAQHQWPQLTGWLDAAESRRCLGFRMQADRQAYILAHALRRLAVASALAVPAGRVSFASDASGKPRLVAPAGPPLYFSHARRRNLVACAVSRIGPVGIDVESTADGIADLGLLRGLVELPDAPRREAELGSDAAGQFYFYWTALEAYWKCRGGGLSFANPPLRCRKALGQGFSLSLADDAGAGRAWALALQAPPGCAATLVLETGQGEAVQDAVQVVYRLPVFLKEDARQAEASVCA